MTSQAKRDAAKEKRRQAAQETDPVKKEALQQELTVKELELEKIEGTITRTERQNVAFDALLTDRQRTLDQIRADFERNNAEFERSLQAEAARTSELLRKRREAARVCQGLLARACGS